MHLTEIHLRALTALCMHLNQKMGLLPMYTYMRIILTIHLSVLSHTSVYAFAESPGVRVCHADYALGPTTLLCNAMQCEMQCIRIALCCTHCNPRKHLSVRMSVKKRPRPTDRQIRNYQSAKDADANKHHV